MAYTKQTWADLPSKTTPINATRLGHIEDGIYNAAATADNAASAAGTAVSQIGQVSSRVDTLTGRVNGLDTAVSNKVDKVAGKGLSTNDYDNTDKGKVDSLGTASTKNSTSVVTESSDLVESGAVKDIVGWGNKNHNKGDASKTFVKSSARTYSFPVSIPIVSGKKYKFVVDVSNISGYTGVDAIGLRISKTGGDISSTYFIQTTAQGQIVIEMTATGNGDLANIYCFIPSTEPDNATITFSNVMFVEENVTDYTYEPYHASVKESKCDNTVIAPVENGSKASQAYAVGEHFIKDGQFKEFTQAISSGGAISDSNTENKPIAELLDNFFKNAPTFTELSQIKPSMGYGEFKDNANPTGSGSLYSPYICFGNKEHYTVLLYRTGNTTLYVNRTDDSGQTWAGWKTVVLT